MDKTCALLTLPCKSFLLHGGCSLTVIMCPPAVLTNILKEQVSSGLDCCNMCSSAQMAAAICAHQPKWLLQYVLISPNGSMIFPHHPHHSPTHLDSNCIAWDRHSGGCSTSQSLWETTMIQFIIASSHCSSDHNERQDTGTLAWHSLSDPGIVPPLNLVSVHIWFLSCTALFTASVAWPSIPGPPNTFFINESARSISLTLLEGCSSPRYCLTPATPYSNSPPQILITHTFQWPVPSSFSPPPHSPTSASPLAPLAHASPSAYIAPHIRHAPALPSLQLSCHHQQFIPFTLDFQPFNYQPIGNAINPRTVSSASGSHQSTSLPQTRDTSPGLPVSSSDVTNDCANNQSHLSFSLYSRLTAHNVSFPSATIISNYSYIQPNPSGFHPPGFNLLFNTPCKPLTFYTNSATLLTFHASGCSCSILLGKVWCVTRPHNQHCRPDVIILGSQPPLEAQAMLMEGNDKQVYVSSPFATTSFLFYLFFSPL
ncbi:putative signal peptide protein [Puccinia sorghi]|uniref:Putative signal peptide protein n=1 Tax=Puccinia sorghi TaxID=27349 RepID=A0A0L6V829_9BASI|nr:putative signal peptide protein [Puccinia sorghi]